MRLYNIRMQTCRGCIFLLISRQISKFFASPSLNVGVHLLILVNPQGGTGLRWSGARPWWVLREDALSPKTARTGIPYASSDFDLCSFINKYIYIYIFINIEKSSLSGKSNPSQQLEMLKYMRRFHPDDQSVILETVSASISHQGSRIFPSIDYSWPLTSAVFYNYPFSTTQLTVDICSSAGRWRAPTSVAAPPSSHLSRLRRSYGLEPPHRLGVRVKTLLAVSACSHCPLELTFLCLSVCLPPTLRGFFKTIPLIKELDSDVGPCWAKPLGWDIQWGPIYNQRGVGGIWAH